jgi:hypothetical protein
MTSTLSTLDGHRLRPMNPPDGRRTLPQLDPLEASAMRHFVTRLLIPALVCLAVCAHARAAAPELTGNWLQVRDVGAGEFVTVPLQTTERAFSGAVSGPGFGAGSVDGWVPIRGGEGCSGRGKGPDLRN